MSSAFSSSGGRVMPAAFGSGDRDAKRAQAAETAARDAAVARAKKIEATAAATRLADAQNFASEKSYPSLGGAGKAVAKPVTMNFKKTVQESAARPPPPPARIQQDVPKAAIRAPPMEDYESELEEMAYAGDEGEESEGEFNADLGSTRRRGDKGIW